MGETVAGGAYQDKRTGVWLDANGEAIKAPTGETVTSSVSVADAGYVKPESFVGYTIPQVLALVEDGTFTPAEALEVESTSQMRSSLMRDLEAREAARADY
jgi:hypothetical protein